MGDFDRDIRGAFHARSLPGAPAALFESLTSLPPRPARPTLGSLRLVIGLAAALVVLLVAAVALTGGSPTVPPVGSPFPSVPVVVSPAVEPSAVSPTPSSGPSASAVPSPTPQQSPAGQTATPAANVTAAGQVDPSHGWAVAGQRLVLTDDGGLSWYDRTPPAAIATDLNILAVEFLVPDHGWIAIAEPFKSATDPGFGRIDVWRTIDAGHTWLKSELPKALIHNQGDTLGEVALDFLDATHGLAFITGGSATSAHDSDLFWTSDGGRTWAADRPTGPGSSGIEGTVVFANATDGLIVGSPVGSGVYVTHDAGKTWQAGTLGAPAGMAGDQRFFGRPVFISPSLALVPVRFQADTGNVTRIYRSTDGGSSWSFLAHLPGTGAPLVSILDKQRWIAPSGSDVVATGIAGSTWTTVASRPAQTNLQTAQFLDLTTGWAVYDNAVGNGVLIATSDGGATWRTLHP